MQMGPLRVSFWSYRRVDLRRPVTMRVIVKWILVGMGPVVFGFGFLGAATGSALPALPTMQHHVLAELVGKWPLVVLGLMMRTPRR